MRYTQGRGGIDLAKGKSFGWTEAEKEEYYKKAEKIVEGIDGLEIDRDQFGVRGQSEFAIVHMSIRKND